MSNKAKKTKIVNIRVTDEEKLNWVLFAHACGTNTSGLALITKDLLTAPLEIFDFRL